MLGFAKRLVKQAEVIIAPEIADDAGRDADAAYGFRVIHVAEGSPAKSAGMESLFDYIVAVNNEKLVPIKSVSHSEAGARVEIESPPHARLEQLIGDSPGVTAELQVWSAKGRTMRKIHVPSAGKLGMDVQWTPFSAADSVWHVLGVNSGSPAEAAGLHAHADYIVAAENGLLEQGGESLLGKVISRASNASPDGSVTLYVYNHDYDTLRPVKITPVDDGQGNKLLGCGVGYGFLHRLPAVARSNLPPGDTLFEETTSSASAIPPMPHAPAVPPQTQLKDGSKLAPPPTALPYRPHHSQTHKAKQTDDLSSYFDEQTKISRDRDVPAASMRTKSDGPPPPPPTSSSSSKTK